MEDLLKQCIRSATRGLGAAKVPVPKCVCPNVSRSALNLLGLCLGRGNAEEAAL